MGIDPLAAYTEPMEARVQDGEVLIIGPRNMCGAFVPEAAEESAKRMLKAVEMLRSQAHKED